jgi:hypothetical protein
MQGLVLLMSEFVSFGEGRKSLTFGGSDVAPGVSVLMFTGNPFAIFRGVIAEVVFTFYFVSVRRWFAHIGKEVFKFLPTFTDSNAFGSVKLIGVADRRGIATFQHSAPDFVNSGLAHAVCCISFTAGTSSGLLFGRFGLPLTSTISRSASSEVSGVNPRSVSALASTEPKCTVAAPIRSWDGFMWSGDSPKVENLVCPINKRFTHMFYITDEKQFTEGICLWQH